MNRAMKRKQYRESRIQENKENPVLRQKDISSIKEEVSKENVNNILTCVALAEHRLYGFGQTRVLRTLQYIDKVLMQDILDDKATIHDYKRALSDEIGVYIK